MNEAVNPSDGQPVPRHEAAAAAERISKAFGGVLALCDVDFDLKRGEIHALMGENGAGKSTLMKILAGVHTAYEGAIFVMGTPVRFAGVRDAERAGIAIIHQELNLVPGLTAAENIFLGREPLIAGTVIDRRRIAKAASALLRRLGISIDPEVRVAELRVGEQQLVEIAKALSLDARILIMDEPTSALSSSECATLFKVVRQLAKAGVAIVYTSHRIGEVFALADRVTVLRDGKRVLTAPIRNLSESAVIKAMVGRRATASRRDTCARTGPVFLSVRNLTLDTVSGRGWRRALHGVSFELRRGEILGIGGLLGSGRTEVLESLFGASRGWRGGEIAIDGSTVVIDPPADACRRGFALVTEDRKAHGLHLSSSIRDNVVLPSIGAMSRFGLRAFAREEAWPRTSSPRTSRCAATDRTDRLYVIRRQSAEDRHRQMVGHSTTSPPAGRADTRHRCRCQTGNLRAHLQILAANGLRDHRRYVRASRIAPTFRPNPGDVRGTADRGAPPRGSDRGGGHASCGTRVAAALEGGSA